MKFCRHSGFDRGLSFSLSLDAAHLTTLINHCNHIHYSPILIITPAWTRPLHEEPLHNNVHCPTTESIGSAKLRTDHAQQEACSKHLFLSQLYPTPRGLSHLHPRPLGHGHDAVWHPGQPIISVSSLVL